MQLYQDLLQVDPQTKNFEVFSFYNLGRKLHLLNHIVTAFDVGTNTSFQIEHAFCISNMDYLVTVLEIMRKLTLELECVDSQKQ